LHFTVAAGFPADSFKPSAAISEYRIIDSST